MSNGLHVEVIGHDGDAVVLRVKSRNGAFAGCADCHVGHDTFARLAGALRGFPTSRTDRRDVTVGTFDPGRPGGGVRLVFECGATGSRVAVNVTVRAESGEVASFTFPAEVAAMNEFVAQLERARISTGVFAALYQAT